ncbi:MAG: sigma-54-dependent Fis family transcriptional regulator [Candidatus Latescibacterota bacterium]|jgi:DNA-binding NtrC family response regulator|nr:MAG: sigma-54-dependent Fis family transcriptional regulator [Candidatus Latescibacterota bacterium]
MRKVLIVDDDVAVTNYFMVFLMQTALFEPTVVNDSREVETVLARETFDAVMLDMDMPNVSGMDILRSMRTKGDTTPVVVLTGVSDVDLAVRAMKLGAFDYLTKPVDDQNLLEVLENAIETRALHETIDHLPADLTRQDLAHEAAFTHLPTREDGMIRLFHQAEKLAASDVSIFIWGESGSGKEMLARAIHAASPRRDGPFVVVEADSRDPDEFPAFFFGQARDWSGAREESPGLLERADNGTLFLNHIDALTLPVQVRLKRLLQNGEYYRESSTAIRKANVRTIVSSMHDLTRPEYAGRFSRDLLYHLMINSIRIPPLRERRRDIPLLAELFLKEESERAGKTIQGFSPECMELLERYSYPDNVQELVTIVAGAVANADGDAITADSLPAYIRDRIERGGAAAFTPRRLDEVVREHVRDTLAHFGRQREEAAKVLGITPAEMDRIIAEDLAEE